MHERNYERYHRFIDNIMFAFDDRYISPNCDPVENHLYRDNINDINDTSSLPDDLPINSIEENKSNRNQIETNLVLRCVNIVLLMFQNIYEGIFSIIDGIFGSLMSETNETIYVRKSKCSQRLQYSILGQIILIKEMIKRLYDLMREPLKNNSHQSNMQIIVDQLQEIKQNLINIEDKLEQSKTQITELQNVSKDKLPLNDSVSETDSLSVIESSQQHCPIFKKILKYNKAWNKIKDRIEFLKDESIVDLIRNYNKNKNYKDWYLKYGGSIDKINAILDDDNSITWTKVALCLDDELRQNSFEVI